jgi:hypothetical protein
MSFKLYLISYSETLELGYYNGFHVLNRIVVTNFFNLFSFTVARESPKFRLKWMTQTKLEIVRVAVTLEVYTLIKGFDNLCSLGAE